ncbi:ATP-dependent DNA ligase [Cohnella zeiphila]|uniref:ATP-dependent DNA ligase n=1 Tax=Cohnella zeiphila TaxID=2761120 RepID=A0A7X0SMM5_9BACL|nr:ATP-dependent DNA ligase [Cohnella zeiphila]MBB6732679.1 ATP-dependent DNA ligase [Cohnella zeiphila]
MFLTPMLLAKREDPFDDPRYLYEPKIDGHRAIFSIENGVARIYTRHHSDVTRQYPELHEVPIADDSDMVLDGEIAVVDLETGAVDFEAVMRRFQLRKAEKIRVAAATQPVHFFAFDILRYKGMDLRKLPLIERKEILAAALDNSPYFSRVLSVENEGTALFNVIKERKLEGIVAKQKSGVYVGRRSESWQKIINYTYADVYISGYLKNQFGWLVEYNGRPAGIIEFDSTVPAAQKQAFYSVARKLVTGEDRNFVYVEPMIEARVRFRNWTKSGKMRSPEFVGFTV